MDNEQSPFVSREMAVMWQAKSAERRACYHQAYQLARLAIEKALAESDPGRPKAVILDIDETVLDNSPFFARLLAQGVKVPDESLVSLFIEWLESGEAKAQAGAVEFLLYARSMGVKPFYVSNRPESMMEATARNLEGQGCPDATPGRILLKDGPVNFFGKKEELWSRVAADHDVLLHIGDNLEDLATEFSDRDGDHGFGVVDANAGSFGTRFILVPNPMYGPWERVLEQEL